MTNTCTSKQTHVHQTIIIRHNIMRKFFLTAVFMIVLQAVYSQITPTTPKTDTAAAPVLTTPQTTTVKKEHKKIDLSNRSNDHLLIQYGYDGWAGTNDSTKPSGFSRFFNAYIMLDKPFKTNPHMSVGLGVGIGSSNIFFDRRNVDVRSTSVRMPFTNVDSLNHFKKFKL